MKEMTMAIAVVKVEPKPHSINHGAPTFLRWRNRL
jgi:hypothetical protein